MHASLQLERIGLDMRHLVWLPQNLVWILVDLVCRWFAISKPCKPWQTNWGSLDILAPRCPWIPDSQEPLALKLAAGKSRISGPGPRTGQPQVRDRLVGPPAGPGQTGHYLWSLSRAHRSTGVCGPPFQSNRLLILFTVGRKTGQGPRYPVQGPCHIYNGIPTYIFIGMS